MGLFDGLLVGVKEGLRDNVGSEVGELMGLIDIEGLKLGCWDRAIDGVNEGGKVGA